MIKKIVTGTAIGVGAFLVGHFVGIMTYIRYLRKEHPDIHEEIQYRQNLDKYRDNFPFEE